MSIQGYVCWSIYVRASSVKKAKTTHLPPIVEALEGTEFEWEVFTEKGNPGVIRLVNYQNLQTESVEEIVLTVLRRAYGLVNNWSISGLHDLVRNELRSINGHWDNGGKPSSRAPALESMMFELLPGRVRISPVHGALEFVDKMDLYFDMPREWPREP